MPNNKRPVERYRPQFKAKVLKFVLNKDSSDNASTSSNTTKTTILAAAKKFSVHPTSISDWIRQNRLEQELKQIYETRNVTNSTGANHSNSPVILYPQLEEFQSKVINWLREARKSIQAEVAKSAGGGYLLKYGVSEISKEMNGYLKTAIEESSEEERRVIFASWMAAWCKRLHESEYNDVRDLENQGLIDQIPALKTIKYAKPFKREIAHFAKIIGQRRAGRMFGVAQRRIFDWITELNQASSLSSGESSDDSTLNSNGNSSRIEDAALPVVSQSEAVEIQEPPAKKQRLQASKPKETVPIPEINKDTSSSIKLKPKAAVQIANTDIDKEVFEWVQSRLPLKPSSTEIRHKARELYRSQGFDQIKCSYGWYRRWSERYNISHGYQDDSDLEILEWLLQGLDNNEILTYEKIQEFAKSKISKAKPNFKASANWVNRFIKRHHVIMNWEGHYKESLPPQLESKAQDFLNSVNSNYADIRDVCCMDEIPLHFSSSSLEAPREDSLSNPDEFDLRPIKLRKSSIKHCEATVILSLLRDGTLMLPMIIVKCQSKANTNQIHTKKDNPVIVFYSKTTEPTRTSLEKWFDLVWRKNYSSTRDGVGRSSSSLLLWDSYQVHSELKTKCDKLSITTEAFPLGCACKLQPLNVLARRSFLEHIEGEWIKYMGQNMSATDITWPSTNEIVDWVYSAYLSLGDFKEKLKESFDTVGFRFS